MSVRIENNERVINIAALAHDSEEAGPRSVTKLTVFPPFCQAEAISRASGVLTNQQLFASLYVINCSIPQDLTM